jgi:hypothetical protein
MTDPLYTVHAAEWMYPLPAADAAATTRALEEGRVLFMPRLAFTLSAAEKRFLSPQWSDGRAKNVSYDPAAQAIRHTSAASDDRAALAAMMSRYAQAARTLVSSLCPGYSRGLTWGLTSYRPVSAANRETSARKDDTRLHVDAFASRPVHGQRILRVFSNINPAGVPRVWELGEPFDAVAAHFRDRIAPPWPGSAWLMEKLQVTKGRRSTYDHLMLGLHDQAKLDTGYQAASEKTRVEFPANTTWIVFTDVVMHAALGGQYLLEQTFYLPPAAMQDESRAPLRRLEQLYQQALV